MQAEAPAPRPRDASFDIAKGIGILAVLVLHSSNNSSRLYAISGSVTWWTLTAVNRLVNFAVPLFFLISCVLATLSLERNPDLKNFYRRRLSAILWPYLVWTAIFWLFRVAFEPPPAGRLSFFTNPARLSELFWGKAYFHLYFMGVLLQLVLVLPFVYRLIKKANPSPVLIAIATIVLQALVLVAQHHLKLKYPASTFFWYTASLIPGVWVGLNWKRFAGRMTTLGWVLASLALATTAPWMMEAKGEIDKTLSNAYGFNGALVTYGSAVSLVLLALAAHMAKRSERWTALIALGQDSLQIYLIHPIYIVILGTSRISGALKATHLGPLLGFCLTLGLTYATVIGLRKVGIERWLFGRSGA